MRIPKKLNHKQAVELVLKFRKAYPKLDIWHNNYGMAVEKKLTKRQQSVLASEQEAYCRGLRIGEENAKRDLERQLAVARDKVKAGKLDALVATTKMAESMTNMAIAIQHIVDDIRS